MFTAPRVWFDFDQEIEQYVLRVMPGDTYASHADRDREQIYLMAEHVENDLRRAADQLKDTVKKMNDSQIEGGDRSDAVRWGCLVYCSAD